MKVFLARQTPKKILLSLLFIVSLVVLLSQMSGNHSLSLLSDDLYSPDKVVSNGKVTVIADEAGTTVHILNEKEDLIKRELLFGTSNDEIFEETYSMIIIGNKLYMEGIKYKEGTLDISEEKIVEYSLKGDYIRTVYSKQYTSNRPTSPRIIQMFEKNGRLEYVETSNNTLYIMDMSSLKPVIIDSVQIPYEVNRCFVAGDKFLLRDNTLGYYIYDTTAKTLKSADDSAFTKVLTEHYGLSDLAFAKMFRHNNTSLVYDISGVQNKDGQFEKIYGISTMHDGVLTYSKPEGKLSTIRDISVTLSVKLSRILFWAAALVMIGFAVLFLIRIIKALKRARFLRVPVLLLCLSLFICGFYTWNMASDYLEDCDTTLNAQADNIAAVIQEDCPDVLKIESTDEFNKYISKKENRDKIADFTRSMDRYYDIFGTESMYGSFVGVVHGNGISALYVSNYKYETGLTSYALSDIINNQSMVQSILTTESVREKSAVMTNSDRSISVVINSYCYMDLLIKKMIDEGSWIFLTMMVIFSIIFIFYRIGKAFVEDRSVLKRLQAPTRSDQIKTRLPIAAFIANTAETSQSIVWLFIAKDLYGGDEATSDSTVSIVLIAINAGIFIGMSGGAILKKRFRERSIGITGLALSVFAYAFTIGAILLDSFWLFVIGNFITGIAMYGFICRAIMNTIAYTVDNKEDSTTLVKRTQQSYLGSTIVGIAIGGFITQYLGNSTLYVISGVLVLVLAIVMIPMFSNQKVSEIVQESTDEDSYAKGGKNALGLLKRPVFITFVLCSMLPFALLSQYSSYQYPIYASSIGLEPMFISNISVITQSIIFVFFAFIMNRFKWSGPRASIIRLIFVSGLFLVGFFICPNYGWAITSLFVIQYMTRPYNSEAPEYVARMAAREGFNVPDSQSLYQTLLMCMTILSILILSSLMLLGANNANIITGIGTVVLILVFMAISTVDKRKRKAIKHAAARAERERRQQLATE